MILLSIGYSKENRDIYDRINELCGYLKDKSINTAIVENDVGGMHYIKCLLRDTENDIKEFELYRDVFYSYASNIIHGFIAEEYEFSIVQKFLDENYDYLDSQDIKEIKSRSMSVILGTGIFTKDGMVISQNCKNKIIRKVDEFLCDSVEIILDGFVTFRLRDINKDIEEIIDEVVEEYVLEREYTEFVKLLKYFVDIQESKYSCLNLIITCNGEYIIEDENYKDITKEFFEDFDIKSSDEDTMKSDMLISALITCAPQKIVLHGINNCQSKDILETIKSIFGERFQVCSGCDVCVKMNAELIKK